MALVSESTDSCFQHPFCHILRGLKGSISPHSFKFSFQHKRIWDLVTSRVDYSVFHNTPLWYRKLLPELFQVPDSSIWLSRGILLSHLLHNGEIKTFDQLKIEFNLPNHMLFHFFQVHHALHTQFMATHPDISSLDILTVILCEEPSQLITLFYNMLTFYNQTSLLC